MEDDAYFVMIILLQRLHKGFLVGDVGEVDEVLHV